MEQRLSLVTLGVADVARSRRFYAQGLDWTRYFADPDGHVWEVASNPHFPLRADGSLELPR